MNAIDFNQHIYVKDDEKWKLSVCVQKRCIDMDLYANEMKEYIWTSIHRDIAMNTEIQ